VLVDGAITANFIRYPSESVMAGILVRAVRYACACRNRAAAEQGRTRPIAHLTATVLRRVAQRRADGRLAA
jgi:hypothetical protein